MANKMHFICVRVCVCECVSIRRSWKNKPTHNRNLMVEKMNCLVYAVDLWLDSNSWVTAGNIQSERDYHEPKIQQQLLLQQTQ